MNKAKFLAAASVFALGFAANVNAAETAKKEEAKGAEAAKIKCAGVVKEDGKNDCATSKHSCSGKAKAGDKEAWKFVASEEECKKEGGSVVKEEKKS